MTDNRAIKYTNFKKLASGDGDSVSASEGLRSKHSSINSASGTKLKLLDDKDSDKNNILQYLNYGDLSKKGKEIKKVEVKRKESENIIDQEEKDLIKETEKGKAKTESIYSEESDKEEEEPEDHEYNDSGKESWEIYRKLEKRDKINDSDTEDSESETEKNIRWVILPDNFYKRTWDIYIAYLLIYSAIVTPYRIAFVDDEDFGFFNYFDYFIDLSFFVDLVLNFFSAYIDNEDNIVTKRKRITKNYLKSWFAIDVLSVLPIGLFTDSEASLSSVSTGRVTNTIGKIARIPKLYRLIRLTKLFRMVKMAKQGNVNRITRYFLEKLKVSANIERLIYFILGFLILNHLSACIFYLVAKIEDLGPDTWVTRLGYIDYDSIDIYIVAFYWNLATVTTVGYGDVSSGTTFERIYNMFIMSFGVFMYSFAIGSLSSIVSTLDAKTAEMNQKLQTLFSIRKEFKLDQDIYDKVRKVIKYDLSRNQKDKMNFLQELPNKLRIELSQIIHDNIIKKMYFFKDQQPDLIAFVAPFLKPIKFSQNEILYKIGDNMDEMYFVYKGTITFCLTEQYGNKEIKEVKKNNNFGEIEMCLNEKLSHLIKVKSRNTELYVFKKNDFLKLSFNYKEFIEKFLQKSLMLYLKFNDEKKKVIKEYELKNNIKVDTNADEEQSLEKISEEEEDNVSEEYNVYDDHPLFSERGEDPDDVEAEDNSDSIIENENAIQKGEFNDIPVNNLENATNNREKEEKNEIIHLIKNGIGTKDKLKYEKSSINNTMNKTEKIPSMISNLNTFQLPFESFPILKEKAKSNNYDPHSSNSALYSGTSNGNSNITTAGILKPNKSSNSNNKNLMEDHSFKEMKTNIAPILEINQHVEAVKEELFMDFKNKIEKIVEFFEINKIKIEGKSDEDNPIQLLKKLITIREITDRNDIIDRIEMIISQL